MGRAASIGGRGSGPACDSLLQKSDRKFPARAATHTRAQSVGDQLREGQRAVQTAIGDNPDRRFGKLPIRDSMAQANVHVAVHSFS